MLHEPGHQSQRTASVKAKSMPTPIPPTQDAVSSTEFHAPGVYEQPKPFVQYPPQTMAINRPGCVTVTALVFFLMASLSCLSSMGALILLDPLALIANAGTAFIFGMTGFGLWAMYRWGANLVILFAATTIAQFVLLYIFSALLIDDYVTSAIGQGYIMVFCGAGILTVAVSLGVVWWWFARTRRWFLANTVFPQYEQTLYWFAIIIFVLGIVISLVSLPDAFEQQRSEFDQINRDIENIYRTSEPVEDNSPFGS